MTDHPIKTRPDGSIDTDHYMRRGRRMRSEAAHEMFRGQRGKSISTASTQPGMFPSLLARALRLGKAT